MQNKLKVKFFLNLCLLKLHFYNLKKFFTAKIFNITYYSKKINVDILYLHH